MTTAKLATCQCTVMTTNSCGALATQEDFLCDECRSIRVLPHGPPKLHYAPHGDGGKHLTYQNANITLGALSITSGDQLAAAGWVHKL